MKLRKKNNDKPQKEKKLSLVQKWVLAAALIVLIVATFPVALVIIIGLLPSVTLLITDPHNGNKLIIVGCFNLTGVFICLTNLINQIGAIEPFTIRNNIFNLLIMLGAAGFGMILYYELPNLFVKLSTSSSQRRIKNIDSKLEKLTAEWGNNNQTSPSEK